MGEVELGISGEEGTLTALKEPRGWGRVQTIIGPAATGWEKHWLLWGTWGGHWSQ